MSRIRMHPDEIETDAALVRRLLADQFPQWADLSITLVPSYGTDHDIYQLGETLALRLPRIGWATKQAAKEAEWLPKLAPHLPLALPVQVAMGHSTDDYPYDWSVYEWLPGENANGTLRDLEQAAVDLAGFVKALWDIDTKGAPQRSIGAREGLLIENDDEFRDSVAQLGNRANTSAILRLWDESLEAPAWEGQDVWLHGDLLPGNLLVVDGRLSAVIDFGTLNVGDPDCDLLPAWNIFSGTSRETYRAELEVDDASWLRGRGWALYQAVVALPYYWDTNPGIVHQALNALTQVLSETDSSA